MLPEKFLERMNTMLGEEFPRFLQCYDEEEHHALRVNALKIRGENLEKQTGFSMEEVPWCKDGYYYSGEDRPGRHPYHDAGLYYIQEASAMAPVVYLDPQPGERILDLCAAPGGKSTQIGAAMKHKGILVCNEIHPARAKILSENVERMGIRNAIVTNETPQRLEAAFPEYFDRILVDAPCSGEGMFRKNQEAVKEWSPENVALCAGRQDEILSCAAHMLAPGGRLVYSTCTFAPQENEGTILRFLKSHPEFHIEPVEKFPGMAPGVAEWAWQFEEPYGGGGSQTDLTPEGQETMCKSATDFDAGDTIRLWPHRLRGEGHYVAVLRKEGAPPKERCVPLEKGLNQKALREYQDFCKDNFVTPLSGLPVRFGDQLYLAPQNTPSLDKLRVLRPGLHFGTIKKNRLEPSHALALTLTPGDVKRVHHLKANSTKIMDYLKGQTIPAEGEKGWHLITVDGYSIGWGKLSGNVMKNHYPKGLRRL